MEDDYDKVGQEVFHPTAPSGDKIIQLLGCVHLSEVALLFGNSDKRITGTLYNRLTEGDSNLIFEFTDEIELSTLFGENVDIETAISKVMDNRQFGIDDINKAEADVMKGSSRRYYTSSNGTKCEVFEFDRYMGAEQKPKKLLKEVKPVKKIPFYHHRRRF